MTDKPITLPIEHLEVEPDSGKPRIAGRRITVEFLSTFIDDPDWPVEKICREYDLSPAQVYAAWSYYYDHKEEIDRALAEKEARIEKIAKPTSELPGYDEFMSEQP